MRTNTLMATAAALALACAPGAAQAASVSFTELTGVTGGTLAGTGVFRADLSTLGLGQIASISIADNSGGLGGSPGQFSGFDLDAIVISTVLITDASQVGLLTRAAVLDLANSVLAGGTQRPPTDPALFGTSGGQVNNAVATLDAFDGESSTVTPDGFVSLGDNGILSVNLVAPIAVSTPLYLYIGEVGNNGEVAASNVTLSSTPIDVPEPFSLALLGAGLAGLAMVRRRG